MTAAEHKGVYGGFQQDKPRLRKAANIRCLTKARLVLLKTAVNAFVLSRRHFCLGLPCLFCDASATGRRLSLNSLNIRLYSSAQLVGSTNP